MEKQQQQKRLLVISWLVSRHLMFLSLSVKSIIFSNLLLSAEKDQTKPGRLLSASLIYWEGLLAFKYRDFDMLFGIKEQMKKFWYWKKTRKVIVRSLVIKSNWFSRTFKAYKKVSFAFLFTLYVFIYACTCLFGYICVWSVSRDWKKYYKWVRRYLCNSGLVQQQSSA